jgi:hypothetical protein
MFFHSRIFANGTMVIGKMTWRRSSVPSVRAEPVSEILILGPGVDEPADL